MAAWAPLLALAVWGAVAWGDVTAQDALDDRDDGRADVIGAPAAEHPRRHLLVDVVLPLLRRQPLAERARPLQLLRWDRMGGWWLRIGCSH